MPSKKLSVWLAPCVATMRLARVNPLGPAEQEPATFVVFGDSGYSYEYMPPWYSNGVFESKEAFETGFQAYWESIKKTKLSQFKVPPSYYHQDLASIVEENQGLWCPRAERFLLANAPRI